MNMQQQINQHAYELTSQPLQYPIANLALEPTATVVQPGPANVIAAQTGGKARKTKKLTGETATYHGKSYAIRNGPNGGKYLLVKGKKHYV
jgi:hypothetical protein